MQMVDLGEHGPKSPGPVRLWDVIKQKFTAVAPFEYVSIAVNHSQLRCVLSAYERARLDPPSTTSVWPVTNPASLEAR